MSASRRADGRVHVVDERSRRALLTHDVNGMVMVWHGPGEAEFEIASIPEISARDWRPLRWGKPRPFATTVTNVMRDVVDNHHFGPVHGLIRPRTEASERGPFLDFASEGLIDTSRLAGPRLLAHLRIEGRLHGMGLLVYHMTMTMGLQFRYVTLSAATPIDTHRVRIHLAVAMRRAPLGPVTALVESRAFHDYVVNFERDRVHWESPAGRLEPAVPLAEEVELLGRYDRWAARFAVC
jgi:hypothetical protein